MHESDSTLQVKEKSFRTPQDGGGGDVRKKHIWRV